jgi:hypothetical protein
MSGASQRLRSLTLALMAGALMVSGQIARAQPADSRPEETTLSVSAPEGQGILPALVSADWSRTLPSVVRAVVVVHDVLRDAEQAMRIMQQVGAKAEVAADTMLVVAPRFGDEADAVAHGLPAEILRWETDKWPNGGSALAPAPISSFGAIDAILDRLADATRFPALQQVVVAGHGTGAQFVQRFATVGQHDAVLTERGIKIRYVVANAPSYLWFGSDRPRPDSCADADRWPNGLRDAPAYVGAIRGMERRAITRDVVYLLGDAAIETNDPFYAQSCALDSQGSTPFARGMHYLLSLELHHPNLVRHRLLIVQGVDGDAAEMFGSACGMAALFDRPGCVGF